MDILNYYLSIKQNLLSGRYITNQSIEPILAQLPAEFKISTIAQSVLGLPIYAITIGTGDTKIFMWSQMHGNEGTTTKAVFDMLQMLTANDALATTIKQKFTICIIPILNPDGAKAYTRVNANGVDLNRDSELLSQPESIALRNIFDSFRPDYAYNLHDQRTIFGAGNTKNPATVSFLSPAYNVNRDINQTRLKAINVIVAMHNKLQHYIPNQVARFDDTFNSNCIGDKFQSLGVPTILFEAGHYPNDYQREQTRKYIFIALLESLEYLSKPQHDNSYLDQYLSIPENREVFYDYILRNITINAHSDPTIVSIAIQYKEVLKDNGIVFDKYVAAVASTISRFGHQEQDYKNKVYPVLINNIPEIGQNADFLLTNT